jgi:hypothetical protein
MVLSAATADRCVAALSDSAQRNTESDATRLSVVEPLELERHATMATPQIDLQSRPSLR